MLGLIRIESVSEDMRAKFQENFSSVNDSNTANGRISEIEIPNLCLIALDCVPCTGRHGLLSE